MLKQTKIIGAATALTLAIGLSACGSSNDDNPPPAPAPGSQIPPSASSVAGFIAFLQGLASSDTSEPLTVGNFSPPADDTTEPQLLM